MTQLETTKNALLKHGRLLFWERGYSNVSLRQIAKAAGVDVALVGRYSGSKRGYLEATICGLPVLNTQHIPSQDVLIDVIVDLFSSSPIDENYVNAATLVLMNANDPEVGELVRSSIILTWVEPMTDILGSSNRCALFAAAMMGFSVAEKTLRVEGMPSVGTPQYKSQLRHMLQAAINAPV